MWKSKRNVRITYTALPPSDPTLKDADTDRLDDLVEYQTLNSEKVKTVHGVDKAASLGAWNWLGKGWLMIASSHWEVLGWGCYCHGQEREGRIGEGEDWMTTYFAKTLFTPAGVDVYSRRGGLSEGCLEGIKEALKGVGEGPGDESFVKLVNELFEVKHDGESNGNGKGKG